MKPIAKLIVTAAAVAMSTAVLVAPARAAVEAPDALVKRVSTDVIESVKADKDIQAGNNRKIMDLVNSKILPYVDSDKMTAQAAGRYDFVFDGLILTTSQVVAAASRITHTMKTTRPSSPRTTSIAERD